VNNDAALGARVELVEEGGPGRPGVVRVHELEELDVQELELGLPDNWRAHTFPERDLRGRPARVARAVKRARQRCRCESIDVVPGHFEVIQPGTVYVSVSLRPRGDVRRWRRLALCGPCAVAYGLAVLRPRGEDG